MIDSRELSFDDFSAPLSEAAPLGGAGPFVINLGASSAPLELPAEDLAGGSQAYVYRIRRNEDGRIRYRLRLGPFAREQDADAALSRVRNVYPSALTATAWVEDLNAIAVQQAKAGISRPIMEAAPKLRSISVPETRSAPEVPTLDVAVAEPAEPVVESRTAVEPLPASEAVAPEAGFVAEEIILADADADAEAEAEFEGESIALGGESIDLEDGEPTIEALALTDLAVAVVAAADDAPTQAMPGPALEFPELLLLDDAPAAVEPSRPIEGTVASPAATGRAPVLDASFDALSASLSLEEPMPAEPPMISSAVPALTAREAAPTPVALQPTAKPVAAITAAVQPMPLRAVPVQPAAKPAAAKPVPVVRETPLSLETTQTLRPLTSSEMQDEVALRWFVVQLSSSDHAFDPSAVPNLDIFLLYRLYSVASIDQGRPVHALRLGFFGEEMAAQAVASYLKSYYENPSVKRVSVAERERFSEHRLDARKDVGETGQHAAIELSTERPNAKIDMPAMKPAQPQLAQPTAAVRAAALRQISGQQPKKEKPAGVFASLPWIGRRK